MTTICYSVVLFIEEETVCVVSSSWIFKTGEEFFCWWPDYPTDEDNDKAVANHTPPINAGDQQWVIHKIKILGKPYQSLLTARQKRRLGEDTTDINTDVDEKGRPKRRVANRRLVQPRLSHSSEDEPISESMALPTLPLPPVPPPTSVTANTSPNLPATSNPFHPRRSPRKIAKPTVNYKHPTYFSQTVLSGYGTTSNVVSSNTHPPRQDFNHPHLRQSSSPTRLYVNDGLSTSGFQPSTPLSATGSHHHPSDFLSMTIPPHQDVNRPQPHHSSSPTQFYVNERPSTSGCKPSTTPSATSSRHHVISDNDEPQTPSGSNANFQRQILRTLTCMKIIQQQHGEMLDIIIRHIEKSDKDQNPNDANIGTPILIDLPVTSQNEIEELEGKIQNDAAFKAQLTIQLSRCGGTSVQDAVKRMLGRLLSNAIAAEYSWLGFKKKKRFDQLLLKNVLFDAVRRNTLTKLASDQEIEVSVKKWLQHAKQRAEK